MTRGAPKDASADDAPANKRVRALGADLRRGDAISRESAPLRCARVHAACLAVKSQRTNRRRRRARRRPPQRPMRWKRPRR